MTALEYQVLLALRSGKSLSRHIYEAIPDRTPAVIRGCLNALIEEGLARLAGTEKEHPGEWGRPLNRYSQTKEGLKRLKAYERQLERIQHG